MLNAGTKIGPYIIAAPIGAGGMGEVYRARDERLGRDVAIKVLPEAFAGDAARRARFEREAQLLAALNHPNIAAIYGLEVSAGVHALVMELVEGETIAQRLARGPLPLEDALDVARQIAEAFEAAHERGVVHRDLKPANVKVTPGGAIKVLDFGLAKAFAGDAEEDPSQSPTLTSPATRAGVILGTAAYMSPEQARGKAVDKRADIWSFGAVLYEMLTGKQCFGGETVSDTLAGVIRAEPEWDAVPAHVPAGIRRLLRRCLEKDPKRRLRDIGEARIAIEEALAGTRTAVVAPVAGAAGTAPLWRRALPWAVAGALAVALAISLVGGALRSPSVERAVLRLNVSVSPTEPLGVASGPALALSPDGKYIAFVVRRGAETGRRGETQLYLRAMDEFEAKPIPGTEHATTPFFSPDGQWIGFFVGDYLKKVAVAGGPVLTVCRAEAPFGGSWGADSIIFASRWAGESLVRVPASGGEPTVITKPDSKKGENSHRWPEVLPGGRAVLFTVGAGTSFNDARIAVLDLKTGEWRTLIDGGSNPRYADSGHLVFARQETLLAAPFDLDRLAVTGPPVPLLAGLTTNSGSGEAQFSISPQGTLAYLSGGSALAERALLRVDRNGTAHPLGETLRPFEDMTLSPDGRRVAVTVEGAAWNIWVYEIERGTLTRLTTEETNTDPLFTPDGKKIIFTSLRSGKFGLYWKPADGSGPEEQLTSSEHFQHAYSVSRDGRLLSFSERTPVGGGDLWVLPLEGDRPSTSLKAGKPQPFLQTQFNEQLAEFSPDGRWIAYSSDESGREEIYVQPYPGPGGKVQVSVDGGTHSHWALNGRELFYRNGDKMMAVSVVTQPTFSAGKPQVLFTGNYWSAGHDYDVTPDGQGFVFIKSNEKESGATQINVVLNWLDELKRRVPAGKK